MATHKPRLDPILMGEAKILVEVELSKAFPLRIAANDENGFISMVDVEYAWLPSKCGRCGQLGHKVKRCLQDVNDSHLVAPEVIETAAIISDVVTTTSFVTVLESPQPDTTLAPVSDIEVSPDILLDTHNELNSVDPTPVAKVDNLITLATISVLEDMYASIASQPDSTPTDIKDTIESPVLESAQILSVTNTSTAHATSTVQKERSRIAESDLGSNKFASLITLEEEGDSTDSDKEIDSMNLLTPSGKRILRERPVKPSTKAKEMHLYSSARGRGNRGRGNRGGRG
uniref:CCHC-type domain-containing protein n=2 Tax=Brassica oleracea var. oleracea TaxID=109376 RepID=A0A0D3BJ41_BRAOL